MKERKKKFAKSCKICGETFMTENPQEEDTCIKHDYKKMYPDSEAADEALAH